MLPSYYPYYHVVVQDGLRQVSQTTSILTQPSKLPQELIELIQEQTDKLRDNS